MKRRKDRRRHELSKLNALVKYQEQRSFRPIRGADVLASCAFRDRRRIRSDDSTPPKIRTPCSIRTTRRRRAHGRDCRDRADGAAVTTGATGRNRAEVRMMQTLADTGKY